MLLAMLHYTLVRRVTSRGARFKLRVPAEYARFVGIHRTSIINLDFVREFKPIGGGDYRVSFGTAEPD